MNNRNSEHYSTDPDARYGVKGKDKIWFGFKRHVAVDASQGLITAIAVTPANVTDSKAFELIAPEQGAVLGDNGYSIGPAQDEMARRGLHSMAIKKQNAKGKNREKDAFLTALRMPYEGVFSKLSGRARYRGKLKVQFQALCEAIAANFKRLLVLDVEPIPLK